MNPSTTRIIGGLSVPKQYRRRSGLTREIKLVGWDTETINGKAVLLCDSEGHSKEIHSFNDIIEMMMYKKYDGCIGLFYNLAYDVASLVKWTPLNCQRMLLVDGKLSWKNYILKYIPKKQLTISRNNRTHKYQDLQQFYERSLEEAARGFL